MKLTDEQISLLTDAVSAAAARPAVLSAVDELYTRVQAEIDARRPVCQISGRCCRFEEYGHRLFVTTLELAAFLRQLRADERAERPLVLRQAAWDGTGCVFQVGGRCGAHRIRPFGCRIYFCDATSTDWQQEQYEQFHKELRALHERLDVPYLYVEWREALRALDIR